MPFLDSISRTSEVIRPGKCDLVAYLGGAARQGWGGGAGAPRRIGYPVAVKMNSPEITHKSDVGGVILGVGDDEGVRRAVRAIGEAAAGAGARAGGGGGGGPVGSW